MQPLIEYLVRALVDTPEGVRVTELPRQTRLPGAVLYEVQVAPGEMDRLLGNGGHVAAALCVLARAVGEKQGRRVLLDFIAD